MPQNPRFYGFLSIPKKCTFLEFFLFLPDFLEKFPKKDTKKACEQSSQAFNFKILSLIRA